MKIRQALGAFLGLTAVVALAATAVVRAHEMTYQGTVLDVQPTRVQVKAVDTHTKKEESTWFVINKDTKFKRGEKTVTHAEAKIAQGERIVVIVDMDVEPKNLAQEIRLAAAK